MLLIFLTLHTSKNPHLTKINISILIIVKLDDKAKQFFLFFKIKKENIGTTLDGFIV